MDELEERFRELKEMNATQVLVCINALEDEFPGHGFFLIKTLPDGDGHIVDMGANISKQDTLRLLEATMERLKADIEQNNGF